MTHIINKTIKEISDHFHKYEGYPLSYFFSVPFDLSYYKEKNLDLEMEFIGKLMDKGLMLDITHNGVMIVKMENT